MAVKRLKASLITILLIIMCTLPVQAAEPTVLSLGRIAIAMPQVCVEVKGSGYVVEDVTAKLGTEPLRVESMDALSENTSVCTYILVDLSGSVRRSFSLIKENINFYVDNMGRDDKVVILTFGETEVTSLLDGTESKDEIKEKVNALECNEDGTLFYEALKEAYQLSNATLSQFDREYVIAFSDGIDEQRGSTTYDEIKELYKTHTLPLYAACASNTSQEAVDRFGNLARSSGGSIKMIFKTDDFENLVKEIDNITLLKLKADNNVADGQIKQLSIKIAGSQVECEVPITRSLEDNEAPQVKSIRYVAESNLFVIEFTESVLGANTISAYKISNAEGQLVGIDSVKVSDSGTQAEIKMKEEMRNEKYTVSFSGITDCSNEKNPLSTENTVTVEGVVQTNRGSVWPVIACATVCFIAIVAIVLVVVLKSSNKVDDNVDIVGQSSGVNRDIEYKSAPIINEKHHVKAEHITRVRLRIRTGRTSEQNIETNLVSSLIVGRSNICDIYIDDTKLSRQHFVLESDGTNLYIMDLQSRNGTTLNGIRVNSRQILHSGDKIAAGLSDIYITILE